MITRGVDCKNRCVWSFGLCRKKIGYIASYSAECRHGAGVAEVFFVSSKYKTLNRTRELWQGSWSLSQSCRLSYCVTGQRDLRCKWASTPVIPLIDLSNNGSASRAKLVAYQPKKTYVARLWIVVLRERRKGDEDIVPDFSLHFFPSRYLI